MAKNDKCKDCQPYESQFIKEGKQAGFTEEQIDWLCENFSFKEEED